MVATPLLRLALAFHAHFALPVDKTHRINVWFRLVICHYLWDDSLIGKERMSQPVGGNKMLVLNLEDLIVEAATELAISGECDVPVENNWGGVDLVAAGYRESIPASRGVTMIDGVRLAIEDGTLHMYKFESFGLAAVVSFKGQMVSSSVLVAIAKEWLA
jgi:hypothetical protein